MKTAFSIFLILLSSAALFFSFWAFRQLKKSDYQPADSGRNFRKNLVLYAAWLLILSGGILTLRTNPSGGAELASAGFGILLLHTLITGLMKIAGIRLLTKDDDDWSHGMRAGIPQQLIIMLLICAIFAAIIYYLNSIF